MRIGFHFPFSGGLKKLKDRIAVSRGNVYQIFARGLRGGKLPKLNETNLQMLLDFQKEKKIVPVVHAPYVYNLANLENLDDEKMLEDINYLQKFRAPYYVIHPGRSLKMDEYEALEYVKYQLWDILNRTDWYGEILVKNSRGAGTEIAYDLRDWMELVKFHPQVKGALDFARLYTAGYDFSTEAKAFKLVNAIEEYIGWENIKVVYINDTHMTLGSRREDRFPPPLGEGTIGFYGYRYLLEFPQVKEKLWIVENSPDSHYYLRSLDYLLSFFE